MKQNILRMYKALRTSLKRERLTLRARLNRIEVALGSLSPVAPATVAVAAPPRRQRRMSAAGRAAIRAGARARWAAYRARKAGRAARKPGRKAKKFFSAAARAALSAAAKARWKKVKAAGRSGL